MTITYSKMGLARMISAAAFCVMVTSAAQAQSVNLTFPADGASIHSFVYGNYNLRGISTDLEYAGDYIQQDLFAPSLPYVTSFANAIPIENLIYASSSENWPETWAAFVNGVQVGSWTATSCGYCGQSQISIVDFSTGTFAPIYSNNGIYRVRYQLTNTIPVDYSYIAFYSGGQATLTAAVPEPETWAMMLSGLWLMGLILKRRTAG